MNLAIGSCCVGFGLGIGFVAGALYEFFRQDSLRRSQARVVRFTPGVKR